MSFRVRLCGDEAGVCSYFFLNGRYILPGGPKRRLVFTDYDMPYAKIAYSLEAGRSLSYVGIRVINIATEEIIDVALEISSLVKRLFIPSDAFEGRRDVDLLLKEQMQNLRQYFSLSDEFSLNNDFSAIAMDESRVVEIIDKGESVCQYDPFYDSVLLFDNYFGCLHLDLVHNIADFSERNFNLVCRIVSLALSLFNEGAGVLSSSLNLVVTKEEGRLKLRRIDYAFDSLERIYRLVDSRIDRRVVLKCARNRGERGIQNELYVLQYIWQEASRRGKEDLQGVICAPHTISLWELNKKVFNDMGGFNVGKITSAFLLPYYNRWDLSHLISMLEDGRFVVENKVDFIRTLLVKAMICLREVHDLGVIHKDVKPHNIFVDSDGDLTKMVLGDFGNSSIGRDELQLMRQREVFLSAREVVNGSFVRRSGTPGFIIGLGMVRNKLVKFDDFDYDVVDKLAMEGNYDEAVNALFKIDIYSMGATILWMLLGGETVWWMPKKPYWKNIEYHVLYTFIDFRMGRSDYQDPRKDLMAGITFCKHYGIDIREAEVLFGFIKDVRLLLKRGVDIKAVKRFVSYLKLGLTEHQAQMVCKRDVIMEYGFSVKQRTVLYKMMSRNYKERPAIDEALAAFL